MKSAIRALVFAAALMPAFTHAQQGARQSTQYDYEDDFTKAVAAHYPPLVRLLITKGGKQNTQDARGDTPLMLAIRSRDQEITDLLLQYQPDLSLLDVQNHSAATEAVLADDADSLKSVLLRGDDLQVAESIALATKLDKPRVLNRFVELRGAADTEEIGRVFLANPLEYFHVGSQVALLFAPAQARSDVCGRPASRLLLQGKICKVDGKRLQVEWQRISNLENENADCSPLKHLHWTRKADGEWNARFLGACGVSPQYFTNVPESFDYRQFLVPELK